MGRRLVARTAVLLLLVTPLWSQTSAPLPDSEPAKTISAVTFPAGVVLVGPKVLSHDPYKRETGLRAIDAALFAAGAEALGKHTIHSPRPVPFQSANGFPSGHTVSAFAVAAALSEREPKDAYWLYPTAAVIGWSRVQLHRHTWGQVIGGAVIGAYVGRRAGKGQWRLLGHKDSQLAPGARAEAAARVLLDRQVVVWGTEF